MATGICSSSFVLYYKDEVTSYVLLTTDGMACPSLNPSSGAGKICSHDKVSYPRISRMPSTLTFRSLMDLLSEVNPIVIMNRYIIHMLHPCWAAIALYVLMYSAIVCQYTSQIIEINPQVGHKMSFNKSLGYHCTCIFDVCCNTQSQICHYTSSIEIQVRLNLYIFVQHQAIAVVLLMYMCSILSSYINCLRMRQKVELVYRSVCLTSSELMICH